MKKKVFAIVFGLFALCAIGYAAAALINTPDVVLPGKIVDGSAPRNAVSYSGEELQYKETRETDVSSTHNIQNADGVVDRKIVYLNSSNDIYSFNEAGELTAYLRAEQIRGANAPAPASDISELEAATAAAVEMGIEVTESQVESSGGTEWGGFDIIFQMGKDPCIEDRVIVTLDADYSLYSIVVQKSGIDTMDEVNTAFFEDALAEYCAGLDTQPSETDVRYKRYGDTITARYTLLFSSEEEGSWTDMVSFADVR